VAENGDRLTACGTSRRRAPTVMRALSKERYEEATLETVIGSALFTDGTLVRNSELGQLPLHHGEAEDWAAESIREYDPLSWKKYAHRLQAYLELVKRVLTNHISHPIRELP
jgi:hypothetical protein